MPDLDTALSAIDAAIADPDSGTRTVCGHCGTALAGSPSDDFCTEECQTRWLAEHAAGPDPVDNGAGPDRDLAEQDPARPMPYMPAPPPPPSGAQILDKVAAFVSRFNVFPSEHCAATLALWYAHTHAAEHFYVTPRLILDSAEPGSGKTRVLEVAQFLVRSAEMTLSATTAALFRLVSDGPITILFDEVDAIFNPAKGGNTEDLRAMLNAGYKRSATIPRCVGDARAMKVERFKVYAPVALAGIAGHMPDTITTRAITFHMRRRAPGETVEPFKERVVERQATPLRDKLATWVASVGNQVGDAEPEMPEGVTDRAAEIWEPLLAIADAAGEHWPATARAACAYFVASNSNRGGSFGIQLLADMRRIFTQRNTDRLPSTFIIAELLEMEESDWTDVKGKPLNPRMMAKELARYDVKPTTFKYDGDSVKGYTTTGATGLADAWSRYLPGTG
ncbi:hypothetical protein AMES_6062 [Amycolatopsis mediterranei S699]|uniref:DUF3631 domain-containing protein n=2 Tax=Amycolatopsis mediterranei TaxID=33910 RepID=A0A0H3DCE7_AMYMU|nr:DUF3631 domain-containing protein [Amycolatopsis mediterranei]ADJ47887.1 conserved hypothetical protein [Amycolatopsis mediterranei U32]AFO79598.1 hypothetical protein AMES_6062 [Amycolatopsis mediterranei S699]AGT86726.1 hypothetical protein B737_6062 [Amycolatopsis mediterranei RB]UZF72894.1 DUF3631 domain-containing protein [Amycolatopsis mediterranei]